MKWAPENIPGSVRDDIVYSAGGVDYRGAGGKIEPGVGGGDVHSLVKMVVIHNKVEVFKHLLRSGFSLQPQNLIYLACLHGCAEMVTVLMETKHVKPDYITKYGFNAVEIAALNGHYNIVKALVQKYGADINFQNPYNHMRPLENAIEGGHLETVRRMMEELGATFSSVTTASEHLEARARTEMSQGELVRPGREWAEIKIYLASSNRLSVSIERRLTTLTTTL